MKVILDGIIYSLQSHGGISVYFNDVMARLGPESEGELVTFTPLLGPPPKADGIGQRVTASARVIMLLVGLEMGWALQRLTMMAGWLLVALVCLRNAAIPLLLASVELVATQLDLSYYLDRLDFTGEVQNLSSLVYLQEWQLVAESLALSAEWGLGFQQLGVQGSDAVAADLIFAILGDNANLLDGGRGAGYFSGTTLLLAAAVMTLLAKHSLPLGDVVAARRRKGPHHRRRADAVRISDLDFQRIDDRARVDRTT